MADKDEVPDFILPSDMPKAVEPEDNSPDFHLPSEPLPRAPTNPGMLANSPDDSIASSIAKGAGTAAIQGAADVPGIAGNMGGMVDYLMARAQSAITGRPVQDIMAEHVALTQAQKQHSRNTLGFAMPDAPSGDQIAAPVLAKTGQYQTDNPYGQIAMMGTRAATGSALMGGTGMIPKGFIAGAAGEGATQITGDPLAGLAAGAVVPEVAGRAVISPAGKYLSPLLQSGRTGIAADMLGKAATNPQDALAASNAGQRQVIPGSSPNLAEQTGDIGLAQATKRAATADQTFADAQSAAAGTQNAARSSAIDAMAPADGDIMSPSNYLTKRLSDIDAAHDNVIDQLTQQANALHANILHDINPEVAGSNLRTAMQGANDAAEQLRNKLYAQVDPEDKLAVVATPARDAAQNILGSVDPSVSIPSDIATPIMQMGANLPPVMSFNKLSAFDSTVTAAMAQAKRAGDNFGHAQLVKLKSAVMNSINNAVEHQHAWEQAAVGRGELDPANSIAGRLDNDRAVTGFGNSGRDSSANDIAQAVGASSVGAPVGSGSGVEAGQEPGRLRASTGDQGIQSLLGQGRDNNPGAFAGTGAVQNISGANPGANTRSVGQAEVLGSSPSQGVSQTNNPELQPNFDEGAAARLATAKQAHAKLAQNFRQGPVESALDTHGFAGQYKASGAAVGDKAFPAGNTGYATTKAFLNASDNSPEAVSALQDIAAGRLQKRMKGDVLDPKTLATWKQEHRWALAALDEASPGFSSKFDDAATATQAMADAKATKVKALQQAQEGAAGKLIGATTPDEVRARVGQLLSAVDGPTQIRNLIQRMQRDKASVQGLQRAGAEYIRDAVTNAGTVGGEHIISSAKLNGLLAKNADAVEALFGKDGLSTMRAIAADTERSQKALDNMRVRTGSDTAANLYPKMKELAQKVGHISIASAMGIAGWEAISHGDFIKAAGIAGIQGLRLAAAKMRANGIEKANDLYLRGLEDPEVGKALLQTYIVRGGRVNVGALSRLGQAIERSSRMIAPLQQNAAPKREEHKSGGRVGKSHEFLVNRLVKLAELAKKDQQASTKLILGAPDPLVVQALKLVNQSTG